MKSFVLALVAGMTFAFGLVVSGMTNPAKVLGFLDILGHWDYSLMFVMVGAIVFNFISFRMLTKRDKPFFSEQWYLPSNLKIDKRLFLGSAMFGIGWGIMGVCPGPGLVNLVTLQPAALQFVLSMLVGMYLFSLTEKFWSKS